MPTFAPLTLDVQPPLAFRFGVVFLAGGAIPNPVDLAFQKVSGIGATVETDSVDEGGQNLYIQRLPRKIIYENLVLERGMLVGSPLRIEVNAALTLFQFVPANVLVNLLGTSELPLASWLFLQAFPVKWSLADLNATANEVVIEYLELAYQRMQIIGL
jgi:phage tail-like protein